MSKQDNNTDNGNNGDDHSSIIKFEGNIQVRRFKKLYPNIYKVSTSFSSASSSLFEMLAALFKTGQTRIDLTRERVNRKRKIEQALSDKTEAEQHVTERSIEHQFRIEDIVVLCLQRLSEQETDNAPDETVVEEINSDWLRMFYTEAGSRDMPEVKEAFTRILAGEIQQPGTFSLGTLRTVSSLSAEVARLIVIASSHSIDLEKLTNGTVSGIMIPALDGRLSGNSLAEYGLGYIKLLLLSEYNIIFSSFNTSITFKVGSNEDSKELKLNGALFTSVGREIQTIVDDVRVSDNYFERLEKHISSQVGDRITINRKQH